MMGHPTGTRVIPTKYLIATLFIAGMLLLVAIVQGLRPASGGGIVADAPAAVLGLDSFPAEASFRLEDGWAPRFEGAQDPDQSEPWPFPGGFGAPWEPASPYLLDQGFVANGPQGRSEVVLWRGLEWRTYRFDSPLVSARMDPARPDRLLVTLAAGPGRYETELLEIPEGRVLWSVMAGPWSRFSWGGRAVLVGFFEGGDRHLLLSAIPADGESQEPTLAAWDEKGLPPAPKGLPEKAEQLSDDGRDLAGAKLALPWQEGDRLWMPRADRLWVAARGGWTSWRLVDRRWRREAAGPGLLTAQPPLRMGLTAPVAAPAEGMVRSWSPVDEVAWTPAPVDEPAWPAYDPAWAWGQGSALTAWGLQWRPFPEPLAPERQRVALAAAFKPDWLSAKALRRSVAGWLPSGPEVALREAQGRAWVWVGDQVRLVKLPELARSRRVRKILNP
ncbi:MAG TPA: hypothetical protein VFM16_07785 [Holophagaceae bacterium]|nr:hypothetical protein [Holophagaceae bacterium]